MEAEELNREQQLQKLKEFTINTDKQLNNLLNSLGWTDENIKNVRQNSNTLFIN